jgi:pSer/pThr/pTyr-binding forkhead associated (FHA) protein
VAWIRRDEDATVSDRHFEIWLEHDPDNRCIFRLRDLGSTNGTVINRLAADPEVTRPVTVGSLIMAGRTHFRLTASRQIGGVVGAPELPKKNVFPSLVTLACPLECFR